MTVPDAQTTIHELLSEHPHLKPWLVEYAPEFKKLANPVLYNTIARVATIETAAGMAAIPVDTFLDDVRVAIARRVNEAEDRASAAAADDPGRERRRELLKEIIRELHGGASVDDVKARFDTLVSEVDATEIASMEQSLITDGMPVEEVQRLCDVHVTVFKDALDDRPDATVAGDHPIDAYQRENAMAGTICEALRCEFEELATAAGARFEELLGEIASDLERLAQVDTHYLRKENQLFPALEHHGVEGPTKVMWALDDDIRGRIKTARALVAAGDAKTLLGMGPELLGMVEDMIYKEEKILFPTALQVVTAEEWGEMAAGDSEIGYAWVDGPSGDAARASAAVPPAATGGTGELLLPLVTGALTLEQLNLMFGALPFDVSFVDEHDRVRFYTEGNRVFPRSPAAIGREIRNCHPPKSLHKVEQILAAFKAGEQDEAEFWIEMGPRFIHIRYFALRDEAGTYRGCLEVVQDATHVRRLSGNRRIVDW